MEFEQYQSPIMLGPMTVQQALSQVPIFGEHKTDIGGLIQKALQPHYAFPQDYTEDSMINTAQLPDSFSKELSTAQKLQELRGISRRTSRKASETAMSQSHTSIEDNKQNSDDPSVGRNDPPSNRQLHEKLLSQNIDARGMPKEAQILLDHILLLRANNKYLFEPAINRDVVSDDPWLRDLWDWVGGKSSHYRTRIIGYQLTHYRRRKRCGRGRDDCSRP